MRDGRASRVGPSLMKCLDLPDVAGFPLQTLLELTIPEDLSPVDWLQPESLQDRPLELRSHNGHTFSAELQPLPPQGWLLILQPIAQSIQDLHRYGLTLQDLSLSDPLRQRVLPALLNEGLQELLLQEANKAYTNAETANIEASWLDLRLEE
ncbi:hypothetical protein KBZ14_15035 [Synechococcus sp. HJ21-Hayes]|uniref:hypothetical protein n=1 Tax=Synechococcus sp. HJ21-Hayes TaxID=2823736 RepID=UPI0020CE2C67|nr:hypothetical protein [Synechococcus sp. HJ21-Hayes]MCP9854172.1 hypothetical protein [Synechococcus sp. HJ21-Hayes]